MLICWLPAFSPFLSPAEKAAGDMVMVCVCPSVIPSIRLSVLPSNIFVRSISPKVFEISTSNFTSGYTCISLTRRAVYKNHYSIFSTFFFWNFCTEHISKSMKAWNLKLHTHIELIEEACSAEDPLLCLQYFWSYCPL